jgi:hypothetical protein
MKVFKSFPTLAPLAELSPSSGGGLISSRVFELIRRLLTQTRYFGFYRGSYAAREV